MNIPSYDSSASVRSLYRQITLALIEKGLTITTMESCTSGQIASLLTDTEGSSAILKGAFVTYCNEAKIMQGVPADIISCYGVYSEETARAMASASRKAYSADISIGVTGSMGNPDPANRDSIPGEIFFAIDFCGQMHVRHLSLSPQPDRLTWKLVVAGMIGELLLSLISEK